MATIIGTNNSDDTTLLGSLFTGHGMVLLGTDDDDQIYGLAGNDLIAAGGGDDYIDGGTGADVMQGDQGDDVYIVDNAGDQVRELAGEGNDKVVTSVTFTLSDNVETLTLAS